LWALSVRPGPETKVDQPAAGGILIVDSSPVHKGIALTTEELRAFLRQREVAFEEKPVPHGTQFRCRSGEIFNVFESGKVSYQGKATSDLSREIQQWESGAPSPEEPSPEENPVRRAGGPDDRVFIVYGHDQTARDGLELLLRRMGMEPIVLGKLPAGGDTIIEKLERYLGRDGGVGFACVLLTPDDEGNPVAKPESKHYRARQNVVLELGMVLARLGRTRVAILHKESVELPSDIHGLLYIAFKERVEEARNQLFQELEAAGYRPRAEGLR
jgi:predicted nucleotide-binding protein